ncbi:MAG: ferric reductase-like transmembrane domain-containing protein [Thermoleophilia bacterium]
MTPEMLPWVISRATGFTAFALITAAVVAGLLVRTRGAVGPLRGAGMVDLHRHLSFLGLIAIAVHGGALLFDATIDVSPAALVVPGLIDYLPVATGVGVAVAELALLIHLSSRYRARIGVTAWRRLHWLTYAVFIGGAAHGILSGTDSGARAAQVLYGGSVAAVAALTGWRAATARREAMSKRAATRHTARVDDARTRDLERSAA